MMNYIDDFDEDFHTNRAKFAEIKAVQGGPIFL